ncbi:hypothetical protein Y1Q_0013396 [Alligator mississippiensis]|uniref:Uncharacterized protein n=1 Tax=Alligator mississippiensis TaxID=8496 RepID=A0A151NVX4_ALLMI|nr:hypothetical protein Y1Q_0013396 [Alligator mississippiensis]
MMLQEALPSGHQLSQSLILRKCPVPHWTFPPCLRRVFRSTPGQICIGSEWWEARSLESKSNMELDRTLLLPPPHKPVLLVQCRDDIIFCCWRTRNSSIKSL